MPPPRLCARTGALCDLSRKNGNCLKTRDGAKLARCVPCKYKRFLLLYNVQELGVGFQDVCTNSWNNPPLPLRPIYVSYPPFPPRPGADVRLWESGSIMHSKHQVFMSKNVVKQSNLNFYKSRIFKHKYYSETKKNLFFKFGIFGNFWLLKYFVKT